MEYVTLLWKLFVEQWTNWFAWVQKDDNTAQLTWLMLWLSLALWPLTYRLGRARQRRMQDLRDQRDEADRNAREARAEVKAYEDGEATGHDAQVTIKFDMSTDFDALVHKIIENMAAKGFNLSKLVTTPPLPPPVPKPPSAKCGKALPGDDV